MVFVIDSTDIERLGTAADELAAMLNEEELHDAALLVFANKQDQPGAKGAGEISEALKLGELRDRNWSIVACSAIDGKGINEGMDWLVVGFSRCNLLVSQTNYVSTCSKQSSPRMHDFLAFYVGFRISSLIPWCSGFSQLGSLLLHECCSTPSLRLCPAESLSYIPS